MTHGNDILLTEDYDLQIENGDFAVGKADQQNVQIIFLAHPGEVKEWPMLGFGASKYLKSRVTQAKFYRDLKLQLEYDGYKDPVLKNGIEQIIIEV
jgi:hypothetical protein